MNETKSFWNKYAAQRRAQRSQANLRRRSGIGTRRASNPARPARAAR